MTVSGRAGLSETPRIAGEPLAQPQHAPDQRGRDLGAWRPRKTLNGGFRVPTQVGSLCQVPGVKDRRLRDHCSFATERPVPGDRNYPSVVSHAVLLAVSFTLAVGCATRRPGEELTQLNALGVEHPSAANVVDTKGTFYLGGVEVNEPDHRVWVDTLKRIGMNTVEVTVYLRQGDGDSDDLWEQAYGGWSVNNGVVHEIRAAKSAGLSVALILRIALDSRHARNQFLWHGMIMPRDEALLRSWFQKYRRFAVKWAKICQEMNVDIFAIGSELNALASTVPVDRMPVLAEYFLNTNKQERLKGDTLTFENDLTARQLRMRGTNNSNSLGAYLDGRIGAHDRWARQITFDGDPNHIELENRRRRFLEANWISLIGEVREHYQGKLTFAANFDNYDQISFWRYLDMVGINAYFPLRELGDADVVPGNLYAQCRNSWEKVFEDIDAFRASQGIMDLPVLLTELGYTSRRNSTVEPWTKSGFSVIGEGEASRMIVWDEEPVDRHERVVAVNALYDAVQKGGYDLKGILYWKLTTDERHLDIEPFALHIATEATDPLQDALLRFVVR